MIFMEPMTCPHATCGRTWTPRKANPVKCPTCQNPLWQSPRPKRSTISRRVDPVKFKPTEVPVADDDVEGIDFYRQNSDGTYTLLGSNVDLGQNGGSSSVVERPPVKQDANVGSQPDALLLATGGGSSVQIPASPHYEDPLAARKARVQSLLAGVI